MTEQALKEVTTAADEQVRDARRKFAAAVRAAHREGLSQRQIAVASNRSQPEIARLLRFRGTSPHARRLRRLRSELIALLADHGMASVRVFGSTALGTDTDESDVDLLVTSTQPLGLLAQARAEVAASELLGLSVDLVTDDAIREDLHERIMTEAIPL